MLEGWLRRRRLLAEARRLEAEAREVRRTLLHAMAHRWGPLPALASLALVSVGRFYGPPGLRATAAAAQQAMLDRDEKRAAELEARARALREEAASTP